ncbi:hypothetical protein L195_g060317, partial [Trifolium pratense]
EDKIVDEDVYAAEVLDILATPSIPSIEEPPSLELKSLPENLKYAYLERDETLPAIEWTLADIPEIKNAGTDKGFKVNGWQLKLLHERLMLEETVEELPLEEPSYTPAATP